MYSITRNAPYAHPRLDSILELRLTFPIGANASNKRLCGLLSKMSKQKVII